MNITKFDKIMVAIGLVVVLSVLAKVWHHDRQQQLADAKRSFHVLDLHQNDVLSGDVLVTADVSGRGYGYLEVVLAVDGQFADSTESGLINGKKRIQCKLLTNHFANGTHTVSLVGPNKGEDFQVTFRNPVAAVRVKDFNAVYTDNLKNKPPVQGTFKATVANPQRNCCWAVVIQECPGTVAKTFYGQGANIAIAWNGQSDAGHQTNPGPYIVKAGAGPTRKAALNSALKSPNLGWIQTL